MLPSLSTLVLPAAGNSYLGNFREDIAENCGVGAWRAGKGLTLLGMNLVGTGLTKKNMMDPSYCSSWDRWVGRDG